MSQMAGHWAATAEAVFNPRAVHVGFSLKALGQALPRVLLFLLVRISLLKLRTLHQSIDQSFTASTM